MHRAGVVHRDLKPENVIIRPDRTACLVDLGVAKWTKFDLGAKLDPESDFEEIVDVTPAPVSGYRPPETGDDGLYDELGDQYAWGVLAHELLVGTTLADDAHEDLPAATTAVIERARSERREERYDNMAALLEVLQRNGQTPSVAPTSVAKETEVGPPKQAEIQRTSAPGVLSPTMFRIGLVMLLALVVAVLVLTLR
jgi:serine/threonine protein kinase